MYPLKTTRSRLELYTKYILTSIINRFSSVVIQNMKNKNIYFLIVTEEKKIFLT